MVDEEATLHNIRFEDCEIVGPAVLCHLEGPVVFENCRHFAPLLNAVLWTIPESQLAGIGGVVLKHCTFHRCLFRQIGLAGKNQILLAITAQFE